MSPWTLQSASKIAFLTFRDRVYGEAYFQLATCTAFTISFPISVNCSVNTFDVTGLAIINAHFQSLSAIQTMVASETSK